MTNNPDKTAALVRHGLAVTGREPMPVQAGEHNLRYLRTKRDRMGHDLPWLDAAAGVRPAATSTPHRHRAQPSTSIEERHERQGRTRTDRDELR